MPKPRKLQISLEATPYYHCVSRCVRRAFLCGKDFTTGRSYEHRKHQIEHDLLKTATIFFIDIAAYAVLSNHYHVVLHVDSEACKQASSKDIIRRWHQVYKGNALSHRFLDGESLEPHELNQVTVLIETWRSRLFNISWFMKVINERIARQANKEDECTGHFWESRYKSQALLDEKAVLSAIAYVDLNPIRSATASTPEKSDHTSIKLRIECWKNGLDKNRNDSSSGLQPKSLMPFSEKLSEPVSHCLNFNLIDYIKLVESTGRIIQNGKRGAISPDTPPILQRLNISTDHWVDLSTNFERRFKGIAGASESIKNLKAYFGLTRHVNRSNSETLYS